jgi:hypothetical protein
MTRSVPALSARPIRRWISWVRPVWPFFASRRLRVLVARGSMPYSAVTQPSPLLRSHGGALASTDAVHNTWVSPNRISTEPSAWRVKPVSMVILRNSSARRPDGRMASLPFWLFVTAFADRAVFSEPEGSRPAPEPVRLTRHAGDIRSSVMQPHLEPGPVDGRIRTKP